MLKIHFEEGESGFGLDKILPAAASELGQAAPMQVDVVFLSRQEMQELNQATRNIGKETDVLSYPNLDNIYQKVLKPQDYPQEIDPETGCIILGEIAICLDVAKEQAAEFGHSFEREIGYLAVHGLLHLFGFDHETEQDKLAMREAEERILKKCDLKR